MALVSVKEKLESIKWSFFFNFADFSFILLRISQDQSFLFVSFKHCSLF